MAKVKKPNPKPKKFKKDDDQKAILKQNNENQKINQKGVAVGGDGGDVVIVKSNLIGVSVSAGNGGNATVTQTANQNQTNNATVTVDDGI